jgi:hypothetical protein
MIHRLGPRPRRDNPTFFADLETVAFGDGFLLTTVMLRLDDEIVGIRNFLDRIEAETFARRARYRVSRGQGLVSAAPDGGSTVTYYVDEESRA